MFCFVLHGRLGTGVLQQIIHFEKKKRLGKKWLEAEHAEGGGENVLFFFLVFIFYHIELTRIITNIEQGIAFVQISCIAIFIDFLFRIVGERLQKLLPEDDIFLILAVGDRALNMHTHTHTHHHHHHQKKNHSFPS